uniref:Large ribosomal subunit protein uL22c n=1 Tax=Gymnospermium microrrhynchum TaxID=168831 RepID=A0A161AS11_9MAGN|nr:ribosomal protein L22 [Gymnospermium microrrhynchum]AIX89863.1 ribosomal protein L22 [Gymnospermium microrrhynchum]UUC03440.1 ribosomal protein L22 [Gymnospermium microrrhynchum]
MIKMKPGIEVYALGQHICMSAHKARRVIDQIRGRPYDEILMILELMPYRACYPIFKLVYSAAANATHNKNFNKTALIMSQAEVNEGTIVKKLKPRARGRSYPIKRPTCHITIVLQDISKEKSFFIWLKKKGWIYQEKYIAIRLRYEYIQYEMRHWDRLEWVNYESEVLWDKK